MLKNCFKKSFRKSRKKRIKKKLFPLKNYCLCIYKSNKNLYLQVINNKSKVIFSTDSSEINKSLGRFLSREEFLFNLSKNISCKLLKNGISKVVFYRNGYLYSGNIKKILNYVKSYGIKI